MGLVFTILVILHYISTEYIKRMMNLQENNQRYQSLFLHNPDVVFSIDRGGNILDINASFTKMLGYRLHDIVHKSIFQFIHTEDSAEMNSQLRDLLNGKPLNSFVDLVDIYGDKQPYSVTFGPTVIQDEVVGAYGIAKKLNRGRD